MADENFPTNLLRMIAASMHFQNSLAASTAMFGKSYFDLGVGEKTAVDHAVFSFLSGNYQAITPEFLEGQQAPQPMGFPIRGPEPNQGNTSNGRSS